MMIDKPQKRNHKSKRSVKRKLQVDLEEARRNEDIINRFTLDIIWTNQLSMVWTKKKLDKEIAPLSWLFQNL